jgi:diketogulonate reductase-like aldo/keto reductase
MSTFALGHMQIRRPGYGAMQLAGPYAIGASADRASAIGVLRAAVSAGVDHIDTVQYYGPGGVNDLIREALYPYPGGLAIVSKVAVRPDDGGAVRPSGDPDQLRDGIEDNLRSLRVGQLAAVNLRLPSDGRVDARFDDQLAAMVAARDEGLIAGVGLSNVSLEQLRHAAAGTDIVCVQNLFHLADRRSATLLEECLSRGIAFVPFCPLGWPRGQVVLGEAALRTLVCTPETLAGQLSKLLSVIQLPALELGIIGFSQPMPVFPFTAFSVRDDDLIVIERLTGEQYLRAEERMRSGRDSFPARVMTGNVRLLSDLRKRALSGLPRQAGPSLGRPVPSGGPPRRSPRPAAATPRDRRA